jgi:hypothetical protein
MVILPVMAKIAILVSVNSDIIENNPEFWEESSRERL